MALRGTDSESYITEYTVVYVETTRLGTPVEVVRALDTHVSNLDTLLIRGSRKSQCSSL